MLGIPTALLPGMASDDIKTVEIPVFTFEPKPLRKEIGHFQKVAIRDPNVDCNAVTQEMPIFVPDWNKE